MRKVTVHRWRRYDVASDDYIMSRRYGTQDAIERVCGEMISGTAIEVDESDLDFDFPGMTLRNFSADRRAGFQTEVRS